MEDPAAGYRALHAKLKKEEDFKDVSLKKAMASSNENDVKEAPDFVSKVLLKPGADGHSKAADSWKHPQSGSCGPSV